VRPALLILLLAACACADEAFAKGERLALVARDDVVLELWRPPGSATGRVVFHNRNELPVRVTYSVSTGALTQVEYEAELDGKEVTPFAEAAQIALPDRRWPEVRLVRVAKLPIEEASGYVLIAEDHEGAIGLFLFRPATGGNRAYAVIANGGRLPVAITWQAIGLTEAPPLTFTTVVPARATLGREGGIPLEYHPAADPRDFMQARVRILTAERKAAAP
jgi:hypothetical protein